MTARTAILAEVEAALEAAADFTGVSCIQFDGSNLNDIEATLRGVGTVLVIPPAVSFSPREQAAGSALGDLRFVVRLCINPTVNAALETPKVFENLRAAIPETLLAIAADEHGERYRLISDDLSDFDSGLLMADLVFDRACQINPA